MLMIRIVLIFSHFTHTEKQKKIEVTEPQEVPKKMATKLQVFEECHFQKI